MLLWQWRYVGRINSVVYMKGKKKRERERERERKKSVKKVLKAVALGCRVCPCGRGWVRVLWPFPGWGSLCLCSGWQTWISSLWMAVQCSVVGFVVSVGSLCVWAVILAFVVFSSFSSVVQSWQTLCNPMNFSMSGLHVPQQLPEFTETHVH